jgi:hypothetical protein
MKFAKILFVQRMLREIEGGAQCFSIPLIKQLSKKNDLSVVSFSYSDKSNLESLPFQERIVLLVCSSGRTINIIFK